MAASELALLALRRWRVPRVASLPAALAKGLAPGPLETGRRPIVDAVLVFVHALVTAGPPAVFQTLLVDIIRVMLARGALLGVLDLAALEAGRIVPVLALLLARGGLYDTRVGDLAEVERLL